MSFKLIITCRQTSSEQIQCQSLSRNYMTMDGFWCQGQGKFYYINTWVRVCSNLTLFGFGSSLVLLVVYMMIEDQMTFIWTCPQISSCQHKRNLRKSMKNMMWTVNCAGNIKRNLTVIIFFYFVTIKHFCMWYYHNKCSYCSWTWHFLQQIFNKTAFRSNFI